VSDEPRTFDLRLWVTVDPSALEAFFDDVLDLARYHPGIEPRWICERRDRQGRPRIARPRVHVPPRFDDRTDNDAADERREGST
jgi:hypothetical protein